MTPQPSKPQMLRSLFLGGLLPVIAYSVVEETWGILWGLVFGMGFGVCEIAYELIKNRTLSPITLIGNGMILILGGISFFTQEGVWFKLQPALIELAMGVILIGSVLLGKSLLVVMAEKQGTFAQMPPTVSEMVKRAFSGLTVRLGIFFLLNAALAAYAALYWSTRDWALLKGVGFTIGVIVNLVIEVLVIRSRIRRSHRKEAIHKGA